MQFYSWKFSETINYNYNSILFSKNSHFPVHVVKSAFWRDWEIQCVCMCDVVAVWGVSGVEMNANSLPILIIISTTNLSYHAVYQPNICITFITWYYCVKKQFNKLRTVVFFWFLFFAENAMQYENDIFLLYWVRLFI